VRHTAFVHCGLHKTGTTAIQLKMAQDRATLRLRHNILYPATRDDHAGHHNLAWELGGDSRFDPRALTIAKATAEIIAFAGDAVLSSEDFETFLHDPAKLAPLVQPLRDSGRDVRLLVYFREPNAYTESLFFELLMHGYAGSLTAFSREIHSTGQLHYKRWIFQFDHRRIRKILGHWPAARLQAFDYNDISQTCSVVDHFLSEIGIPIQDRETTGAERANARPSHEVLLAFYIGNICQRSLTAGETELVHDLLLPLNGPTSRLMFDRVYSAHTAHEIIELAKQPDAARLAALSAWWTGKSRFQKPIFSFIREAISR
jgi:hypothetical protein